MSILSIGRQGVESLSVFAQLFWRLILIQLQLLKKPWDDSLRRYLATLLSDKYLVIPYTECVTPVARSTLQVYDYQDCVGYEQNENGDLLSKPKLIAEIQLPAVVATYLSHSFTHVVCQSHPESEVHDFSQSKRHQPSSRSRIPMAQSRTGIIEIIFIIDTTKGYFRTSDNVNGSWILHYNDFMALFSDGGTRLLSSAVKTVLWEEWIGHAAWFRHDRALDRNSIRGDRAIALAASGYRSVVLRIMDFSPLRVSRARDLLAGNASSSSRTWPMFNIDIESEDLVVTEKGQLVRVVDSKLDEVESSPFLSWKPESRLPYIESQIMIDIGPPWRRRFRGAMIFDHGIIVITVRDLALFRIATNLTFLPARNLRVRRSVYDLPHHLHHLGRVPADGGT